MKRLEFIRQLAIDVKTGKKSVETMRMRELELLLKFNLPVRAWIEQTIDKPLER